MTDIVGPVCRRRRFGWHTWGPTSSSPAEAPRRLAAHTCVGNLMYTYNRGGQKSTIQSVVLIACRSVCAGAEGGHRDCRGGQQGAATRRYEKHSVSCSRPRDTLSCISLLTFMSDDLPPRCVCRVPVLCAARAGRVSYLTLDLSNLKTIDGFVDQLRGKTDALDILVRASLLHT